MTEWDVVELDAELEDDELVDDDDDEPEESEVAGSDGPARRLVRTTKLCPGERPVMTRRPMGGRATHWVFR